MNALAVLAATAPVAVAGLAVLGRGPGPGPAGSDFPDTRTAATHSGLIPGSSPMSTPQQQPYLDLDAVRRRADAATPGPWHIEEDRHDLVRRVTDTSGTLDINLGYLGNRTLADAEFIAHARTDLPALMARQDYLRAAINETALGRAGAEDAADSLRARLHLIQQRVEDITDQDNAVAIGLDLIPLLDGPLHPTHIDDYRNAQEQPADVPGRLITAEALIDAAETRPLTAWEAEEVRSLPRAVRGNIRSSIRREAQLTRYRNAWHSARHRAAHQRSVLADYQVEVSTLRARISAVETALRRYVGCASTTATALCVEVDAALHPTTGTIPLRSPHHDQPKERTAPASLPAPRHQPTPAALDNAARRRLDHLIRRASRALGPAEQTTLLRLWEQQQAAAEQDRRSAAGARRASARTTDLLRTAQDQLVSFQAIVTMLTEQHAEYRAVTGARLRRTTAAHQSTIRENRHQARRADSATAVLGEILRRAGDHHTGQAADLATEIVSLVSLHAVLDTAGIDVSGDLAPTFRPHACFTAQCGTCRNTLTNGDEVLLHFGSPAEAVNEAQGMGWQQTDDGRLLCEACAHPIPPCPTCGPDCTTRTHDRIYRTRGY
ncbi:hypothetical protein GCM10009639_53730 [Kitasatospora putterlickiae]|uniref:Secreted protein n=1 Tax=Kitasatospora putterlickiae TaxID=221725 RepID=A0ABN1YFM0_9ACTN